MEVVIDFRNYAPWYNTVVLLLVSGTALMVWTWTIHGMVSLAHGPRGGLDKLVRGILYGGTAVFVLNAPPVLAPKRTWPAMPPAPWHKGTPPMAVLTKFIRPWCKHEEAEEFPSLPETAVSP